MIYNILYLGDNCIQIFHLGRYIRRYTSPNEKFEYVYPHSNVLFDFYTSKTLYFVQNVSFVSDVNHYVDQSLATLLLTSGFQYHTYKFLVIAGNIANNM